MVEITFPIALSILQTVSLIIGVIYYLMIMRNSQKTRELALKAQEQALETRQTQLLMQIYQELNSAANLKIYIDVLNMEWEDYDDFERRYGSDHNPEDFAKRVSMWRIFNGVGILLRDGLIDVDRVYDLIHSAVFFQWMKWEDVIKEVRVRYGLPEAERWFEYLYDEMMKVRHQRGITVEPAKTLTRYIPDK